MAARVLLVENDALLLSAMRSALITHGLDVVGTATSAAGVVSMAREHQPHVALLDLDLGDGPTGLDIAVALRNEDPHIGLVLLTRYRDPRLMGSDLPDQPQGLIHLAKGDLADAGLVARAVLSAARTPGQKRARSGGSDVPSAYVEVMRMVAEGLSNAEIARRRGVTVKAVDKTVGKLYERFDIPADDSVNRRASLVRTYLTLVGDVEA